MDNRHRPPIVTGEPAALGQALHLIADPDQDRAPVIAYSQGLYGRGGRLPALHVVAEPVFQRVPAQKALDNHPPTCEPIHFTCHMPNSVERGHAGNRFEDLCQTSALNRPDRHVYGART